MGLVTLFSVRTAIALSVIPGLLAALAILYAIRHIPQPATRERQPMRVRIRPVLHGTLGRLMVGIGAFEIGNAAATLLILRATQLLEPDRGEHRATQLALGLYVLYSLAATLASLPAGRQGDRRGPTLVLAGGVACFGFAYAGLAMGSANLVLLALAFAVAGVAIGAIETAKHAAVAALAPVSLRGSAFGLLAAIQGFGNLVASVIAGGLWSLVSGRTAFVYLTVCMIASLVALSRPRMRA